MQRHGRQAKRSYIGAAVAFLAQASQRRHGRLRSHSILRRICRKCTAIGTKLRDSRGSSQMSALLSRYYSKSFFSRFFLMFTAGLVEHPFSGPDHRNRQTVAHVRNWSSPLYGGLSQFSGVHTIAKRTSRRDFPPLGQRGVGLTASYDKMPGLARPGLKMILSVPTGTRICCLTSCSVENLPSTDDSAKKEMPAFESFA